MKPTPLGNAWLRSKSRPLVLGHRGARHALPENSLAAFDLALDEGADGVELDVRLNRDGDAVVCHDATLSRVTQGSDERRIADLTTEECRSVDLGGGQNVPSLQQVLEWAEARQALVNVELKAGRLVDLPLSQRVAQLRRPAFARERLLVSSFSAMTVWAHARMRPSVPTAWLFASRASAWCTSRGAAVSAAVHPDQALITARRVRAWHSRGLRVHAWTVNDAARALALAADGVDALITDHPAHVLTALEAAQPPSKATAPQPRPAAPTARTNRR